MLSQYNRDFENLCGSEEDAEGGREREEERDNQTQGHNFLSTAVFLWQVGTET